MNKAYLLVICLLAASFTGCLSDDTSNLEEQQNTEDETIEPVGTHNNETHDYDILIGEIQNLTDEIDNLNEQIDILSEDLQSLESYRYNPPENSSKIISGWSCRSVEGDEPNTAKQVCGVHNVIEIIKRGNNVTITYIGERADNNYLGGHVYGQNATANCTSEGFAIQFINSEGTVIANYPYTQGRYFRADSSWQVNNECDLLAYDDEFEDYWSSKSIILPEEPVRITYYSGHFDPYTGIIGSTFTFE